MENVKKCKNFLSTLIKLASSGKQSTETAANVKELVQHLLVRGAAGTPAHAPRAGLPPEARGLRGGVARVKCARPPPRAPGHLRLLPWRCQRGRREAGPAPDACLGRGVGGESRVAAG